VVLWLLQLSPAPASTPAGSSSRRYDLATGDQAAPAAGRGRRGGTKAASFLALVTERHGPLAAIPLDKAAKTAATLAPPAELHPGAARQQVQLVKGGPAHRIHIVSSTIALSCR
jgi:hypothetical protein